MTFVNEFDVSDIIAALTFLLAAIGAVFSLIQWRRSVDLKKAEYIRELTEVIRTDEEIKKVMYKIDYGKDWYGPDFHNGGKFEKEMDRTLAYFSYICYLRKKGLIKDAELAFFRYEIERILENKQVQDYFYNLYHFSNKNGTKFSFEYMLSYAQKHKKIDSDFYDKNAWRYGNKYHKYLNF